MNVYEAILRTAALIEARPSAYRFTAITVPFSRANGCACALGWIQFHRGIVRGRLAFNAITALGLGWHVNSNRFYDRMSALDSLWVLRPGACVRALRLYAEKYHAPKCMQRPTSALVADLMAKVKAAPFSKGAVRSPEYAQG
jgi:hypothetical protein